jgi:transposase
MSSITHDSLVGIVVGVDTHKDFHVAAAKDALGRELGHARFDANAAGYERLTQWARAHGEVAAFAIEGAGSYGAGLVRYLAAHGELVAEVARPSRQHRARRGKSDPSDAQAAAAAILSGDALGTAKSADGHIEAMRMLQTTRASAVRAKTSAVVALQSLVVTAPDEIRDELIGLTPRRMVRACAHLSPESSPTTPAEAAIAGLGVLARRYETLEAEAKLLSAQIARLVGLACPELLDLFGVGPEIAATLLVAVGDNGGRLGSERAFAKICGVAPVDASSGRQQRHRLNRGGNRQANRALHTLVVVRLRAHAPSRQYMARRLAEGKTKKEVMRCLKGYMAREIYNTITSGGPDPQKIGLAA